MSESILKEVEQMVEDAFKAGYDAGYKFGLTEIREPVKWFAQQMEQQLKANDHKGGWDNCSMQYLLERLEEETHELTACSNEEQVIQECADIANFAMMIADQARKSLAEKESESSE